MPNPKVDRALGGSPITVAVKLIFLSLIVGAVMAFLGLTPRSLFEAMRTFARSIIDMGADAFWQVAQWIVAGALIVVPVWLILRLFGRK